ncbi:MAG: gliding motility-associated C-terminal domain-containing protein [Crocinitomicaceae bacterium]
MKRILSLILLLSINYFAIAQTSCGCTNCPVAITDNGNFDANIFIQNTGPDILGVDNCLQSVCFTVDHTWIGDLDFALTAPDGTCYLIMADANNDAGGCGSSCDDINVCIEIGTGNPAGTGTTEYATLTPGGGYCVNGNYTIATNVTNPNGSCNSSTADLDAFNNGTGTVSGQWILTIGDNCGLDQGYLTDWSLNFCDETGIDCSSEPVCTTDPGTFTYWKDPVGSAPLALTTLPIVLCEGDAYEIISNDDYILPTDTIDQPIGDGIYSAQLMWLVYDAAPTTNDPSADPGFLSYIIPTEDLMDVNNASSPIVSTFGCGTYYFVPVTGDDGIGGNNNVANGTNDNGGLDWDKDNNDCYLLGNPIEITYSCPIQTVVSVNCNYPTIINGVDIDITGGTGNYTVTNLGAGNLVSGNVNNPGTATVVNLNNGNNWEVQITDQAGCTTSENGTFSGPVISNINITPATDCPAAATGTVDVTVNGTSGQGSPYSITMASDPPTAGTTDSYTDVAGTIVPILVEDAEGCIADSTVTINSAGHYIDVVITDIQGEDCYGDGNGTATIQATPQPSGSVASIVWTDPLGNQVGNTSATHTSESSMIPGVWTVCVTDDIGCEVCVPIEITAPQELDVYVENSNGPVCYGFSDGSIDVAFTGGSAPISISWSHNSSLTGDVANTIPGGTYITYVVDNNGCQDSVVTDLGQPDSLHAFYFIKDVACYGDTSGGIVIDSVAGNFGNVTYNWNMQGQAVTPPTSSNTASGLQEGTYILTILDENGCDNEYQFTIKENPPIEMVENQFGSEPAYCRQFSYQSGNGVVFVAATGGQPGYSYLWTNLGTGATSSNSTWGGLNPGTYQVVVTDDAGCTLVETIELDSVSPIAAFDVVSSQLDGNLEGTAPVDVTFINESEYFANPNNPQADTTFFWNLDTAAQNVWYISKSYFEEMDTLYTGENIFNVCLVAINKNGCKDTACKEIIVHDIPDLTPPNVFTPGNSGTNDEFTFEFLSTAVAEFSAVIIDRWGRPVAELNSITDGWNGDNKNGKPCKDGVYFYNYSVVYTNGTTDEGQGSVTLIREQ